MKSQKLNYDNINFFGEKIMIIASHPDDDILGCGGLLAKLKAYNKIKIKVVFIAEGSSCRFSTDDNINLVNKEIQLRNKFASQALLYLGVTNSSFHNLKCGSLNCYPIIEIGKIIEREISSFKPHTIFTHNEKDLNKDHKIVHQSTLQATRPGALNYVKNLFSYEITSSSEWNFNSAFNPNYFVHLTKVHLNKKVRAFSYYKTEVKKYPSARSLDSIKTLARYRGIQGGSEFAEAYKLIRSLP